MIPYSLLTFSFHSSTLDDSRTDLCTTYSFLPDFWELSQSLSPTCFSQPSVPSTFHPYVPGAYLSFWACSPLARDAGVGRHRIDTHALKSRPFSPAWLPFAFLECSSRHTRHHAGLSTRLLRKFHFFGRTCLLDLGYSSYVIFGPRLTLSWVPYLPVCCVLLCQ